MAKGRRHDIVKPSKYKTSMCAFFVSPDGCPFGDRCAFAHGADELRSDLENAEATESPEKVDLSMATNSNCSGALSKGVDSAASGTEGTSQHLVARVMLSKINNVRVNKPDKTPLSVSTSDGVNLLSRVVSLTEKAAGRGVKPPPKITKGRYHKQTTLLMTTPGNRAMSGGHTTNNGDSNAVPQPRESLQHHPLIEGGLVDKFGENNYQARFSRSSVGTVFVPCLGMVPQFAASLGPHPDALRVVNLSEARMRTAAGCLSPPFISFPAIETETMRSSPGVAFSGYPSQHLTNGNTDGCSYHHYYHLYQSRHSSEQAPVTGASSLLPPALMHGPNSVTPMHHNYVWANIPESGLLFRLPTESDVRGVGSEVERDRLDCRHTQSLSSCDHAAGAEEDSTSVANAAEWHEFIEKWIGSQRATGDGGVVSGDGGGVAYTDPVEKCSFPASRGTDRMEISVQKTGLTHAAPMKIIPGKSTASNTEMSRRRGFAQSFEGCSDEQPVSSPDSNLKGETGAVSKQTTNEGSLGVNGGEGGNSSSDSSSGDGGDNREQSSTQKPCTGCRHCMLRHSRRQHPIVVNSFQSSCAAAAHHFFFHSAEFHVLKNVVKGKDRISAPFPSSKGSQEWEPYLEYCI